MDQIDVRSSQKVRLQTRARPMSGRAGRWLAAAAVVLAMLGGGAVPAAATIVERGDYFETESDAYDHCGYPVAVEAEFSGDYRIREGTNAHESAFFLTDNFSYREIHINQDTGQWFLVRGHGVFKDIRATRVDGSVFEFISAEVGQPLVVENSSGRVVLRDRGAIRLDYLFDTGGDDQPGGTFVEFLGAEVRGPHPGLTLDICEIADGLIGSS